MSMDEIPVVLTGDDLQKIFKNQPQCRLQLGKIRPTRSN